MEAGALIVCILSSSVAAALVTALKDIILDRNKRKDTLEDREDSKEDMIMKNAEHQKMTNEKLESLIVEVHSYMNENNKLMVDIIKSNKLIMLDRIKYIAIGCIEEQEITFENRKLLHAMWDEYHNAWKGNGDLNSIMELVDKLPLKLD